jgi:hypothetical protein
MALQRRRRRARLCRGCSRAAVMGARSTGHPQHRHTMLSGRWSSPSHLQKGALVDTRMRHAEFNRDGVTTVEVRQAVRAAGSAAASATSCAGHGLAVAGAAAIPAPLCPHEQRAGAQPMNACRVCMRMEGGVAVAATCRPCSRARVPCENVFTARAHRHVPPRPAAALTTHSTPHLASGAVSHCTIIVTVAFRRSGRSCVCTPPPPCDLRSVAAEVEAAPRVDFLTSTATPHLQLRDVR